MKSICSKDILPSQYIYESNQENIEKWDCWYFGILYCSVFVFIWSRLEDLSLQPKDSNEDIWRLSLLFVLVYGRDTSFGSGSWGEGLEIYLPPYHQL